MAEEKKSRRGRGHRAATYGSGAVTATDKSVRRQADKLAKRSGEKTIFQQNTEGKSARRVAAISGGSE